jgi:hypothetical protein
MGFQPFANQGDYQVPLLRLLSQMPDGQGKVGEVCDLFETEYASLIPDAHQARTSWSNEPLWKAHVRRGRQDLKVCGFLDASVSGVWRITDAGRQWLAENPDAARIRGVRRQTTPRRDRRRLATTLSVPGITLEMLEQTRKAMPADQFRQVWGSLYDHLLAQERAKAITDVGPTELGRRCRKRLDEIHAFLSGKNTSSPSSEVLCDWIHFCYALELCREAAALLPYVQEDEVDPAIYKRARRVAEVCRGKSGG